MVSLATRTDACRPPERRINPYPQRTAFQNDLFHSLVDRRKRHECCPIRLLVEER